jgi:predicted anti-sigma-YlaC factor YlaD
MVTCHWSARRIGRYLDNDPTAPLTPSEVKRLEEHLAVCEKCSSVTEEHRALHRALSRWSQQRLPDDAALARLHATLDKITAEGGQ